jgi:hypothetical protein
MTPEYTVQLKKKPSTITTHLDTASLRVNTDFILTNLLCLSDTYDAPTKKKKREKNPDQYAKIW